MTRPCKTEGCGGETHRDYPFCPGCMRQLKGAGLCKWCGAAPSTPKGQYCVTCQADAAEARSHHDAARPVYETRYRGRGARENTYETRHGSGH